MIYLVVVFICVILYSLVTNLKLKGVLKHDQQMFKMASLRSDLMNELVFNYNTITKKDAIDAIRLINYSSFTISNHRSLFSGLLNLIKFIAALELSKYELSNVEPITNQVTNTNIKHHYKVFGEILLTNIIEMPTFKVLKSLALLIIFFERLNPLRFKINFHKLFIDIDWFKKKSIQYGLNN